MLLFFYTGEGESSHLDKIANCLLFVTLILIVIEHPTGIDSQKELQCSYLPNVLNSLIKIKSRTQET